MISAEPRQAEIVERVRRELPAVLRSGLQQPGPLAGLVDAMAALVAPRAALIDGGGSLFEPLTAPERFLPMLARWLGYGYLFVDPEDPRRVLKLRQGFPPGVDQLRLFLAAWPRLHASRGSEVGLRLALEMASGRTGFDVVSDPDRRHVAVRASSDLAIWESWLRRLVAAERPLHLTWSLSFGPAAQTP